MGISFSCPFADFDDLDSRLEAVLVKSFSLKGSDVRTALRSVSFNGRDSKPATMKSFSSRKMIIEGSLSFKGRQLETMISFKSPSSDKDDKVFVRSVRSREISDPSPPDSLSKENSNSKFLESGNHRYQAALKLQKVYKSFRTRRQLADCAVLVEQKWWKLLDFAELNGSSISFFDIERPETAVSRWSRARTRAAKVGKGLSKDKKARKLALQHWLEAIDPRHRYGHNLQFYYLNWLHCESKQPFFYWLDIGEGKEVNLDRCSRSKLQQQCIKYLGPTERMAYEVTMENGKFLYKQTGKLLDTMGGPKDAKWIFVLSTSKTLYVGQKSKGTFQHSSFLAGGATLSAGRLVVEEGILKAVWPHSGHYLPTEENFQEFMGFLKEHNVDLTNVEKNPTDVEDEFLAKKKGGIHHRTSTLEAELSQYTKETSAKSSVHNDTDSRKQDSNAAENPSPPMSRLSRGLCLKITKLNIPKRSDVLEMLTKEDLPSGPSCSSYPPEGPESAADDGLESPASDGYETAEESLFSKQDFIIPKMNLFDEDQEEGEEELIPKEKILLRINSHKGMKSYQLAKQLSSKWTTGAGPRIGCMRDYPSELQFRVLEQANLSPRSRNTSRFSPKVFTPTSLCRETTSSNQKKETTTSSSSLSPEKVSLSQTETPKTLFRLRENFD